VRGWVFSLEVDHAIFYVSLNFFFETFTCLGLLGFFFFAFHRSPTSCSSVGFFFGLVLVFVGLVVVCVAVQEREISIILTCPAACIWF